MARALGPAYVRISALDFSCKVDAPIVASLPDSDGSRGPDGIWRLDQART